MKNVLVLYYTQSGQLEQIVKNMAAPLLSDPEITVTFCDIQLEKPFPFPWDKPSFFDAFPESFLQIPAVIHPPSDKILQKKYDLIILGYQVWYLSPSIPVNSFLKSDAAKQLFAGTPVVTVIGARNMWVMAQEKMKVLLKGLKATLVGNIALVDRHINHVSVVTIVQWMFTGKKEKFGMFPKPGVSDQEIDGAGKFGTVLLEYLKSNSFKGLQEKLLENDAVEIRPFLVEMDKKANKMFKKWAGLIIKKTDSRPKWLKVFNVYLFVAIWLISPIVYILHLLKYPLVFNRIKKEKAYYRGV
ncbi:dialkylresorcinol condensing enzyme DarA [Flavobacterium sp. SM15]|uniref:dialkylrecorsinol condensing enzyme DarA n=1 Tax=Flavobacterium sp. SM15 TaxID=2908005 RepID=UPI001EDAB7DC|nr:dialkylrecorsinol condensing enzyme DarA [Flavobacterium sp. SM15]MCG2610971.1 dialkylresorcinol condensing enzyme DarA [Flavobacterium sp. SM15]